MAELDRAALNEFVNAEIIEFHQKRLASLQRLKLNVVLRKKNPYLFKAKNLNAASDLIAAIMSAFLSSSEEEMFGVFLEELAIFVSEKTSAGRKSTAPGLDLEFDRDETRYLVAIKSSTNWGNSSQYARLEENFKRAVQVQRQSRRVAHVQPVLGMCYGKSPAFIDTGVYWKMSGQTFWHFLSGDRTLYADIVEPIGHQARERNDDFEASRCELLNVFTGEFLGRFCDQGGRIDWAKLVAFNSGNMD